jgi:hypothetical protein
MRDGSVQVLGPESACASSSAPSTTFICGPRRSPAHSEPARRFRGQQEPLTSPEPKPSSRTEADFDGFRRTADGHRDGTADAAVWCPARRTWTCSRSTITSGIMLVGATAEP